MAEVVPPMRLRAFEYRGRMKGGRSRPMLVACIDEKGREHKVVLKVREASAAGCSWGAASLGCELVCAIIARMAGITVPDYAVVTVDDEMGFVRNVHDKEARRDLGHNIGENFGSKYLEDHANYVPELQVGSVVRSRLETVMAFDAYVLNNDRKAEKPNLLVRGDRVVLIDHSLCFPHLNSPDIVKPWTEWLPDRSVQNHCAYRKLHGFDPRFESFVEFLNEELTDDDCRKIIDLVPDAWQRSGSRDKNSILRYLLRRSAPFLSEGVGRLVRICQP
jgi:hypothetical protein